MYDFRVGRELRHRPRNPVVETSTEGYEQIRLEDRRIARVRPVHAEPVEIFGLHRVYAAEPHEGCRHGYVEDFRKFVELLGGTRGYYPAAGVYYRPLGRPYHRHYFGDVGVGRLGGRADSGEVGLGFKVGREHLLLNVLGNVYHYGPGPAALGYYKGFLYYSGEVFGVEDEIAVLDYRQRHAEHVGFLEGALADERLEDLAGYRHHRDAVHECVGNCGQKVHRAWAAGDHADADFACRAGVPVRHKTAALFVSGENHADFPGSGEGVVQVYGRAAGIGKDGVNPLVFKAPDDDIRALHHGGLNGFFLRLCLYFHM